MGTAPYKGIQNGAADNSEQKEDWACRICYSKFVEEERVERYRFVAGAKVLCRCGEHKGACFLGTASEAAAKYEARLEWLQRTGNDTCGAGGGRGKPKPTNELERLREENRRLKNAKKSGGSSAGDAAADAEGDPTADDDSEDTTGEKYWDSRIRYYQLVSSNAKRDIASKKGLGTFVGLLRDQISDAELHISHAKEQKNLCRQQSLDPQTALDEETGRNKAAKKRMDAEADLLLKKFSAWEEAAVAVEDQQAKYQTAREAHDASNERLAQLNVARQAVRGPGEHLAAIRVAISDQFVGTVTEAQAPDSDAQVLKAMVDKFEAGAAEIQAALAEYASRQEANRATAAAAAGAACSSGAPPPPPTPLAPTDGTPPPATPPPTTHDGSAPTPAGGAGGGSACPAVDAPQSWARVVAKTPATGGPTTPQKTGKPTSSGTGGTDRSPTPKASLDQILAMDFSAEGRANPYQGRGEAEATKFKRNVRTRADADADLENHMADDSDADYEN